MQREWEKIRSLEQKLGAAGKAEQAMNAKMNDHRMKMENILNRAQLMEEEKEQATTEYDLKNRRGLASQTAKKAQ